MLKKTVILLGMTFLLLQSCQSVPKGVLPVENFDVNQYLGVWYEIARFDFRFEKDMNNVSAQYRIKDNGDIEVFNSGYHTKDKKWKSSTGKAKFRGDKTVGALKVSFFGPFSSGYNVIAIDEDYQYALVAGRSLDYMWILSRTKTIPDEIRKSYVEKAKAAGYDTTKLIWVEHNQENPLLKD